MVEKMSTKFHADAIQGLKRMREQKQFALRIERCALHAFAVPRPPDLHPSVRFVHVPITRHTYNFFRAGISHRKGKHSPFGLAVQPTVNFSFHLRRFWDDGVPQLPELSVMHGLSQIVMVGLRQWFQDRVRSAQSNGFRPGHDGLFSHILIPAVAAGFAMAENMKSKVVYFRSKLMNILRVTWLSSTTSERSWPMGRKTFSRWNQFLTHAQSGTLPAVSFVEPSSEEDLD
jgi:hypothetical protein